MAFRLDVVNNWIQVDFFVDTNHHEDTADHLVKTMNNYGPRTCIKAGTSVRLTHMEMSEALFDQLDKLHTHFPAFRVQAYRSLSVRKVLGVLCGVTVHRNDTLRNSVRFQYKDVLAQPN